MLKFYKDPYEIGVDESGRGPLIGRVYTASVIWGNLEKDEKNEEYYNLIIDSKKLTSKKRQKVLEWIKTNVVAWGIGYAEVEEIDSINILEATCLAMKRAILNIDNKFLENTKNIIIDGCRWEKKFKDLPKDYEITSIVKGDDKYLSIAAASILAKEYHDEHIKNLCKENPDLVEKYKLSSNMGYGTKDHIDGLKKYGPSVFHRKSFKPCK